MNDVVIWAGEPTRDLLARRFLDPMVVGNRAEFGRALARGPSLAFVDASLLAFVETWADQVPIIAIAKESLAVMAEHLERFPWLAHVVSASVLQSPAATEHLGGLYAVIGMQGTDLRPLVRGATKGRFARLLHSRSRPRRIDRLVAYLETQGVSSRRVEVVRDVAEELLTNAFYDAPAAAGLVEPIPRTQEVILTGPYACELAYGVRRKDLVFVRVRDPFGSFARARLVSVLRRCARPGGKVALDEKMGGAGLGLWRIFSTASFVAISVIRKTSTDILVGLYARPPGAKRRSAEQETPSIHLFFDDRPSRRAVWGDPDGGVETEKELEGSVVLRI